MLLEAFLFACVGLAMEVACTALWTDGRPRDVRLIGYTSLWYAPLYALALPYLELLHPRLFAWPFWQRAPVYLASIWAVESAAMAGLRAAFGASPSEESYRRSRWHVAGLIRLDLAPAWIAAAFVFEWLFRGLRGL